MIGRIVDRIDRLPRFWARAFGIVGGAWMVATALDYGRIIDLPEIPLLKGTVGLGLASMYNAIWWGFVNPQIEKHRAARASAAARVSAHG